MLVEDGPHRRQLSLGVQVRGCSANRQAVHPQSVHLPGQAVAAGVGEGAPDVGDVPGAAVVNGMESDQRQREGKKRRSSTGG